jgi:hypothetical protein
MRLRPWIGALALGALAVSASGQNLAGQPPGRIDGTLAPSVPPSAPAPKSPDTYGTSAISYLKVGFTEFSPIDSSTTYSDLSTFSNNFSRYPTAGSNFAFMAVPQLPGGAVVTGIEFDWCDSNAGADALLNLYSSSFSGSGATLQATVTSSASPGCGFSSTSLASPFQIDNFNNELVLVAFVPVTDSSVSLSGAIVKYYLQVSPAPGTATFPDVPTSDFGFQYVEALVASGITGGCGGGLYCPDAPVTRRQMAIFISKALGLAYH